MSYTTLRVKKHSSDHLKQFAKQENTSLQEMFDRLIEEHKRKTFWNKVKKSYTKLKKNQQLWQEELDERKLWETTLMDNLDKHAS